MSVDCFGIEGFVVIQEELSFLIFLHVEDTVGRTVPFGLADSQLAEIAGGGVVSSGLRVAA